MRIRSMVSLVAAALLAGSLPVSAAAPAAVPMRPAILPPEVAFQVVTLRGAGVRGAGFMDYTDDACPLCDGNIIIGLTPEAAYRIAGSPDACGVPYQKSTRVFAYAIAASARGTYWNPRRAVTMRGPTPPASVRVLKGSSGTIEVACGDAIALTDQTGHPLADAPVMVARFDGSDRRGIAFALAQPDGRAKLTAVFADVPGSGPLRLRATSGTCSMTAPIAFTRKLTVSARLTAARTETVDVNETVTVRDIGSVQLGAAETPFRRVACRTATQLATIP